MNNRHRQDRTSASGNRRLSDSRRHDSLIGRGARCAMEGNRLSIAHGIDCFRSAQSRVHPTGPASEASRSEKTSARSIQRARDRPLPKAARDCSDRIPPRKQRVEPIEVVPLTRMRQWAMSGIRSIRARARPQACQHICSTSEQWGQHRRMALPRRQLRATRNRKPLTRWLPGLRPAFAMKTPVCSEGSS